jgi:hypothetical protein
MGRSKLGRMGVPMRRGLIVLTFALLLSGCGKHYWTRQGANVDDFSRDSGECARAVAIETSTDKSYGIIRSDYYKACLKSRGWARAQHPEPVPAGYYRGFEDDEVVKLDTLPRQPEIESPASASSLPPCERGGAFTARDSQGRLRCRP